MSKQKLTKNQKRRIQSNKQKTLSDYEQRSYEKQHEKQYKKQKAELEWQDESLGEIQSGRVVAMRISKVARGRFSVVICGVL